MPSEAGRAVRHFALRVPVRDLYVLPRRLSGPRARSGSAVLPVSPGGTFLLGLQLRVSNVWRNPQAVHQRHLQRGHHHLEPRSAERMHGDPAGSDAEGRGWGYVGYAVVYVYEYGARLRNRGEYVRRGAAAGWGDYGLLSAVRLRPRGPMEAHWCLPGATIATWLTGQASESLELRADRVRRSRDRRRPCRLRLKVPTK